MEIYETYLQGWTSDVPREAPCTCMTCSTSLRHVQGTPRQVPTSWRQRPLDLRPVLAIVRTPLDERPTVVMTLRPRPGATATYSLDALAARGSIISFHVGVVQVFSSIR